MKKQILNLVTVTALLSLFLSAAGSSAIASDYRGAGSPEFLYYIEGTGAYFVPDPEVDIFFSLGNWYRRSGSSWSVSAAFSGPWGSITVGSVPSVLVNLSPGFRSTHNIGRVPSRYVTGSRKGHDEYGPRYYNHGYEDHGRRGFRRRRHSSGGFWFFIAPGLDHDDRDRDRHDSWDDDWYDDRDRDRDDDRDDDRHRRRGRKRGRGRD